MSDPHSQYRRELRQYVTGLVLAVILTTISFTFVAYVDFSRLTLLIIIAVAAVVQVIVHFHYFLHINLSKSKRDDLQLILFSSLIVLLMAGGTIWILMNLKMRM